MSQERPAWSGLRLTFALAGLVFVSVTVGPKAARVGQTRLELIDKATTRLSKRCGVATVDIGWVGASTKSRLLDLAGVTDPDVAALPGGHTSRPIPMSLLEARGIDTVLMRLQAGTEIASPWYQSRFAYATDVWLAPRIDVRWSPRVQTVTAGRLTYLMVEGPSSCVLPAKAQMR